MNGTWEQGSKSARENDADRIAVCEKKKEVSLPMMYVYILVPYSLYVQRGF